MTMARSEIL